MATIHFSSGKTRDIGVKEFNALPVKLNARGIRTMVDRTDERILMIPLNSATIEFIEEIVVLPEEVIDEATDKVPTLEELADELVEAKEDIDEKKDIEEKREEIEAEVLAKSNCTHPAETMVVYRHDTTKGSRYFPVCSFCGKRERYVKADSLTDEAKENAKRWED